jgi:hypothetical protein
MSQVPGSLPLIVLSDIKVQSESTHVYVECSQIVNWLLIDQNSSPVESRSEWSSLHAQTAGLNLL